MTKRVSADLNGVSESGCPRVFQEGTWRSEGCSRESQVSFRSLRFVLGSLRKVSECPRGFHEVLGAFKGVLEQLMGFESRFMDVSGSSEAL